jgi:hypothetical protein
MPEKKSRAFAERSANGLIIRNKRRSQNAQTDSFGPIGGTRSAIFSPFRDWTNDVLRRAALNPELANVVPVH